MQTIQFRKALRAALSLALAALLLWTLPGVTAHASASVVAGGSNTDIIVITTGQTAASFNVMGKLTPSSSDNDWLQTVYDATFSSEKGYKTHIRLSGSTGTETKLTSLAHNTAEPVTLGSVTLKVIPKFELANGVYAKISYTVENPTDSTVTIDLGTWADVQIDSNDRAAINTTSTGLRMADDDTANGAQFNLLCKSTYGVTSVDTLWFGYYYNAEEHLFDPLNSTTAVPGSDGTYAADYSSYTGGDSGLAFSYLNRAIPAHSSRTFSFMMGIGGAAEPPELDVMDDITLDFDVDASQGERKIEVTASVKDVAGREDIIYYVFDDTDGPHELVRWEADGTKMEKTGYITLPSDWTPGSVHKLSVWVQNDKLASSEERVVYVYYPLNPTDPPHEAVKYDVTYDLDIEGEPNTVVEQTEGVPFYLESPSQTKPGSSFAGWKREGTEIIYPAGAEFTMHSAPVTFTAQWCVVPEIQTTSLVFGSVGTAYLQTVAAAGDRPLTWTLSSGSLPAGLNLTQNTEGNAVISETPATAGTYTFTLKAANSGGFDTQEYTLVIYETPPKFDLTVNSHTGTAVDSVTNSYQANTPVSIFTAPFHDGMIFEKWVITGAGHLADPNSTNTIFTTGILDTTVTAQYRNPVLTVTNGSATTPPPWGGIAGSYPAGTEVSITADRASAGQAFKEWMIVSGNGVFASQSSETTTFTTTLADTTIRATYHNVYPLTVTNGTITDGTGGGAYPSGTVVPIAANPHPDAEYEFDKWERVNGMGDFGDVNSAVTTFTTGGALTEIRATYKIKKYALTVQSGTGSGSYRKWDSVPIVADAPPVNMTFSHWEILSGSGVISDKYSASATFTISGGPAVIVARYADLPSYPVIILRPDSDDRVENVDESTAESPLRK